jgi:hypothetical protein
MQKKSAILFKTALSFIENEKYGSAISLFYRILEDLTLKSDFIHKVKEQLSYCYLAIGSLEKAWDLYSYRESGSIYKDFLETNSPVPLWDGTQDLSDKNLLLLAEEGIGDEILYSSFFHLLREKCKTVFIECDKRLRPIYNRSYSDIIFFDRKTTAIDNLIEKADYIGLIGDVTRFINPNFKSSYCFLRSNSSKTCNFQMKLREKYPEKILIGISYRSKGTYGEYRTPSSQFWEDIFYINDKYIFINLQENNQTNPEKRGLLYYHERLHHVDDYDLYNDIDTLTSLIDSMDVVISINNYVSHLAGRLGKRGIILMERMANCRMLLRDEIDHSLWYPRSIVVKNKTWAENQKDLIELLK